MIKNRDFAYVFCLGNQIGISENKFRQEKLSPQVGESRSYELLENIKFSAFTVSHDFGLRKHLVHYDGDGNAYIIVDAFDVDANVYVVCCDNYCIIWDINYEDSPAPP